MSSVREILIKISKFSEEVPDSNAVDPLMQKMCAETAAKETIVSDDILRILDHAVHWSWCGSFLIQVLDIYWRQLLEDEGRPQNWDANSDPETQARREKEFGYS